MARLSEYEQGTLTKFAAAVAGMTVECRYRNIGAPPIEEMGAWMHGLHEILQSSGIEDVDRCMKHIMETTGKVAREVAGVQASGLIIPKH